MKSLVGYTGFVGSNIAAKGDFDNLYNSKNISDAFCTHPDLLVYAGVRAEMFLANTFPEKDFAHIKEALENIKKIAPKYVVLISTMSVYGENPIGDEETEIDESKLTAYGKNRLWLEKKVAENFKNHLIIRLPALYGENLKKNFIYDYIHVIPAMLKKEKIDELCSKNEKLVNFYELQANGFYKCRELNDAERAELKAFFKGCGFSAVNFTDSRSCYQFYNLSFLWDHIQLAIQNEINKLNITTEPVKVSELHEFLAGENFKNELTKQPFNQNLHSIHAKLFDGKQGYFFDKEFVMKDIKNFVEEEEK